MVRCVGRESVGKHVAVRHRLGLSIASISYFLVASVRMILDLHFTPLINPITLVEAILLLLLQLPLLERMLSLHIITQHLPRGK